MEAQPQARGRAEQQSRGPLPRAGPRGWGASEQGGSRGAIRAGGPLLRAGPRGEGQSRGPSPGRDHGGGGVRAGGGLGEPSEQGALPRAGHCVQRGVRAGGPPFQGGAPPQGGATGGRVRAGAPPQGACAPSALTFRSLSDSRNISFTTSLVSAARTVCIVAFVQRVWERHGGTRSETCHLAAQPGPSILAVRLGWGLTPPERPAGPSALRPGCSVDPGAQEVPRATTVESSQAGPGGRQGGRGRWGAQREGARPPSRYTWSCPTLGVGQGQATARR